MTEAEFERRQSLSLSRMAEGDESDEGDPDESQATPPARSSPTSQGSGGRMKTPRGKTTKPRRVQRMFAIEEDLDRKLWLYAIHLGKDRSEVVNDLLRPVVASMVLYDSRDRRSASKSHNDSEATDGQGGDASEVA